jgi:hypothetical protein
MAGAAAGARRGGKDYAMRIWVIPERAGFRFQARASHCDEAARRMEGERNTRPPGGRFRRGRATVVAATLHSTATPSVSVLGYTVRGRSDRSRPCARTIGRFATVQVRRRPVVVAAPNDRSLDHDTGGEMTTGAAPPTPVGTSPPFDAAALPRGTSRNPDPDPADSSTASPHSTRVHSGPGSP